MPAAIRLTRRPAVERKPARHQRCVSSLRAALCLELAEVQALRERPTRMVQVVEEEEGVGAAISRVDCSHGCGWLAWAS